MVFIFQELNDFYVIVNIQYPADWRIEHRYIFKTNFDGIISCMIERLKRSHLTDCLRTVHVAVAVATAAATASTVYYTLIGGSFRSQFLFIKRIIWIAYSLVVILWIEWSWKLSLTIVFAFRICVNFTAHKRHSSDKLFIDGILNRTENLLEKRCWWWLSYKIKWYTNYFLDILDFNPKFKQTSKQTNMVFSCCTDWRN